MHLTLSTPLFGPQLLDDCHSISFYSYVVLPSATPLTLALVRPFGHPSSAAMSIPSNTRCPTRIHSHRRLYKRRTPAVTRQTCVDARLQRRSRVRFYAERASFRGISRLLSRLWAQVCPRYWLTLGMQIRAIRSDDRRYVCSRKTVEGNAKCCLRLLKNAIAFSDSLLRID
jgi:hypothetical protein